jgi:hypothetical protein
MIWKLSDEETTAIDIDFELTPFYKNQLRLEEEMEEERRKKKKIRFHKRIQKM